VINSCNDGRQASNLQGALPNIPGVSKVEEAGRMPPRDSNPVEGRNEYNEVKEAGQLKEPWVSVPRARGAKPDVTATTEPLEDPQGCC